MDAAPGIERTPAEHADDPPPRCRTCGYRIDLGLPERRCPECGRGFDPEDPASYLAGAGRPERPWHRFARAPALWLLALAPIAGATDVYYFAGSFAGVTPFFTGALVALCAVAWCAQDGARRGRHLKRWFIVATFAFPVVFLPIHALRTRGARGLRVIAVAVLLFAGAVALSSAGAAVAYALI